MLVSRGHCPILFGPYSVKTRTRKALPLCDLLTDLRAAKATDHTPCLFYLGCYSSSWIITCPLQTPDRSENSRNTLFPPPILLNPTHYLNVPQRQT
jgi:hypothetical protein